MAAAGQANGARGGKPNNYIRVVTTDDVQGPAASQYIYDVLKKTTVYIIDDTETFGKGVADAFEAEEAFAKGTKIFGLQANGGVQNNIQHETETSGLDFIGFQPRFSYLPFEPFGSSWYAAALEPDVGEILTG